MTTSRRLAAAVLIIVVKLSAGAQQPRDTGELKARSVVLAAKAAALGMKDEYRRRNLLDQIGAAQANSGDLAGAVDTANSCYPHNLEALMSIGAGLERQGYTPKQGKALAEKLENDSAGTVLANFADQLSEKGQIPLALELVRAIKPPEVKRDALAHIANAEAMSGDYTGARNTFATAEAAYSRGQAASADLADMIAKAQIARGDLTGAHATLAALGPTDAAPALIASIDALIKNNEVGVARQWLDEALAGLSSERNDQFVRYLAIPAEVKLGRVAAGIALVEGMAPGMRLKGYATMAVAAAEMKDSGTVELALKKMRAAIGQAHDKEMSEFDAQLLTLDVTAALIENGAAQLASSHLTDMESHLDESLGEMLQRDIRLEKVVILARQKKFDEARALALKMPENSVEDNQRGEAFRYVARLETSAFAADETYFWASALASPEDRGYALLGIADALLGATEVHLSYSVIFTE